jgi:hypothetical protein
LNLNRSGPISLKQAIVSADYLLIQIDTIHGPLRGFATHIQESNGEDSLEPSPPISGLFVGQGFYAGKFLAFEKLQAGAAAGADVGDLVGYPGLVDSRY